MCYGQGFQYFVIMSCHSGDELLFDEALEFEEEIKRESSIFEVPDSQLSNDELCEINVETTKTTSKNGKECETLTPGDILEFENEMEFDEIGDQQCKKLTLAQKARIERNRQKAKIIREKRSYPYVLASPEKKPVKASTSRLVDTGGGFLLEEKDLEVHNGPVTITDLPGPILNPGQPSCIECQEQFHDSYLYRTFDHRVCDSCRDHEDKHSLITKTDVKNQYLLKDCDLDKREPPLKFVLRKNPHNNRWGDMKLYLHLQVEKRALEVWGSEEELAQEHERREEKRSKTKVKKYNKELKSLRMNVRSSLYDRTTAASHQHEFGSDSYNEDDDTYTHTCKTCGYEETFEKM